MTALSEYHYSHANHASRNPVYDPLAIIDYESLAADQCFVLACEHDALERWEVWQVAGLEASRVDTR